MVPILQLLAAASLARGALALAPPLTAQELKDREKELTGLLQARLQEHQTRRDVRFDLGEPSQDAAIKTSTTPQDLYIPANQYAIPQKFWTQAHNELKAAGLSTPVPSAAHVNAPPVTGTPPPWQNVMQEAKQPLNTKLGGAVMYELTGPGTPTPPPTQASVGQQFIAQCPMVLLENTLSIRAPSCNDTFGRWVDPNPLNPRNILGWTPAQAAGNGLFFGVNSALTGPCSAEYATLTEQMTLTGSHFVLKNCLGVERWQIEENVYKIDSMGRVDSTVDPHSITSNTQGYFLKYIIKTPTGVKAAETDLFRMASNAMNFTEIVNSENTGKVLAMVTRQGEWTAKGWEVCMDKSSPRGWTIRFPTTLKPQVATVQDINVAIASAITLMGYRNQDRGANGLNNQGATRDEYVVIGAVSLVAIALIVACNFAVVLTNSGVKDKIKRTLFDIQGLLPKSASQQRCPPLHPTY